jgi:hypothetical protein
VIFDGFNNKQPVEITLQMVNGDVKTGFVAEYFTGILRGPLGHAAQRPFVAGKRRNAVCDRRLSLTSSMDRTKVIRGEKTSTRACVSFA